MMKRKNNDRKTWQAWLLIIGLACVVLFALGVYTILQIPPQLSVEEEALQVTHDLLTAIPQPPVIPDYFENCAAFLKQKLAAYDGEYTLAVTAAFDPDDPRFGYGSNGSRSAEVEVRFPDSSRVELSFYARTWVGCQVD